MKLLLRLLQIVYCVYALLCFVALMFLSLPFVAVFSLMGKVRGGILVYVVCSVWGRLWYMLIGIRHREIFLAPHDKTRQYIFVANHCSYMDIPAIVRSIHQPYRVLGKYEMVKFPVFGIIYRAAVVQVDRSSPEKRARSVRALKAALHRGISIFIFPEGTFNESSQPLKDFYDGAFRIAIETQTPIKPILFVDTHYRMHWRSLFTLTPGKCRSVFLEEVSVSAYTMKDVQRLKTLVYQQMEEGLRKYRKYK
ncbi:MAG TPA: lysophospholipid acyltransferase family protein [Chitinophagaceae bacterium]|nr:lysophospholipid acyltransferase family protein [Chitinophagaceae bacterium]